MINSYTCSKTLCEKRSSFQTMWRFSKLAYMDSKLLIEHWKYIWTKLTVLEKEKTDFFTTHPIFNSLSNEI